MIGFTEIIIIILVIVVLFFGGKKVAGLARNLGRAGGEFKKGKKEIEEELKRGEEEATKEDTDTEQKKESK